MLNTPRYGRKNRKRYKEVLKDQKKLYECPKCRRKTLKRRSFALFVCKSKACSAVVAGGAYRATTEAGETAKRMVLAYQQGIFEQKSEKG